MPASERIGHVEAEHTECESTEPSGTFRHPSSERLVHCYAELSPTVSSGLPGTQEASNIVLCHIVRMRKSVYLGMTALLHPARRSSLETQE